MKSAENQRSDSFRNLIYKFRDAPEQLLQQQTKLIKVDALHFPEVELRGICFAII